MRITAAALRQRCGVYTSDQMDAAAIQQEYAQIYLATLIRRLCV